MSDSNSAGLTPEQEALARAVVDRIYADIAAGVGPLADMAELLKALQSGRMVLA